MSQFCTSGGQSTGVSGSESVLPMNIQDWFPLGWTGWTPCSPRDSQESSPAPHFKSINSLALSFLYSPTLTSIRRRQWHPTPVLLPGKSHGQRSLVGCSPWGCKESDMVSDFTFTFHFHVLEKEMATHSSVLAWRIPGTGQPSGLPSMGSHRVGHDWSDLAAAAAAAYIYPLPLGPLSHPQPFLPI